MRGRKKIHTSVIVHTTKTLNAHLALFSRNCVIRVDVNLAILQIAILLVNTRRGLASESAKIYALDLARTKFSTGNIPKSSAKRSIFSFDIQKNNARCMAKL